jgi:hypothetical protein
MTEERPGLPKVGIKIEPPRFERIHWIYFLLVVVSVFLIGTALVLLVFEWRGAR